MNIVFLVAHVVGRRFSAVVGFDGDELAATAGKVIRSVARRRPAAVCRAARPLRPLYQPPLTLSDVRR